MIVGVGFIPAPRHVAKLRQLVDDPRIFIFPEFFDSKRELVQKRYGRYLQKIVQYRDQIVIALYPDYYYNDDICRAFDDILWIFPLHSLRELERGIPWCVDFIGYASQPSLRDYTLEQFLRAVKPYRRDYGIWYLGANSREVLEAINNDFDGMDVTPLSMKGVQFKHLKQADFPYRFAEWLRQIANGKPKPLVVAHG